MDVEIWLSARELSLLGERLIAGLPKTESGCRRFITKEGWISRDVKGSGGKGGIRTEYLPPAAVLVLIQSFLVANPDFFAKSKTRTKADLAKISKEVFGDAPARLRAAVPIAPQPDDRVYAPIPKFLVHDEDGQEKEISSEVSSLAFHRQWYEQLGLRPVDAVYVRMPDNSMEPTIREGGMVVIDASTDKLRGDGIYCLMSNGNMAVKRLQADFSGGLWVRGDNPAYKEQHVDQAKIEHLNIIGKVIWAGGQL